VEQTPEDEDAPGPFPLQLDRRLRSADRLRCGWIVGFGRRPGCGAGRSSANFGRQSRLVDPFPCGLFRRSVLDGKSPPVVRVHFGGPDGFTSVFPLAVRRFRDAATVSAVCAKWGFVRRTALRRRAASTGKVHGPVQRQEGIGAREGVRLRGRSKALKGATP
jgi:hypothetical protein